MGQGRLTRAVLTLTAVATCVAYVAPHNAARTTSRSSGSVCTSPLQAAVIPYCFVPPTVSPEAQTVLRGTGVTKTPDVTNENIADQFRLAWNAKTAPNSTAAAQRYLSSITNHTIAGVNVTIGMPKGSNKSNSDKLLVYIHGGAYVKGSCYHLWHITAAIAHNLGLCVLCIEYRLAPQYPFPHGLNDVFSVYSELTKRYKPNNIALIGDSAGGSLSLAVTLKAKKEGLPLTAALALIAPFADISKTGDTSTTLTGVDPLLQYELTLQYPVRAYTAGNTSLISNPLVSPLRAQYTTPFPPVLIQIGLRDVLLSIAVLLYRKLKAASIAVTISPWEAMWHVWHNTYALPEAEQAQAEIAGFLREYFLDAVV